MIEKTVLEQKILPILNYVGIIGAGIMTIAYIIAVFVLIKGFQAEAILNMKLRNLRKLEEEEIRAEYDELVEQKNGLEALLGSEELRYAKLSEEINVMKDKFGKKTVPISNNGLSFSIKEKRQTILFLNRRGFSSFVICRDCGYTLKCKRCNISLTYHNKEDRLKCHYCGYEIDNIKICPKCGSKKVKYFGTGTQKIEEELKKSYLEMISLLNAEDYIKILPPRSDIHSVVRDCAMFVSSSDFEGLSNSMIEAMAIGLPCVCTDCLGGGAREIITDGENGLLVPMNNIDALTQAMCHMADNKDFSDKCSENAAKVRETHNVKTIAAKWLDAIENFI